MTATEQLQKFFGFNQFKGQQEEVVESVLRGEDTFVIMPTGGGKSLCYQLPALIMDGTAVVVSPLIALMKNQVDSLRAFSTEKGVAHVLNSSLSKKDVQQVQSDLLNGITKLLYVAPESLSKQENIDLLQRVGISFYAIDEAHCISEWGHDFRPEYRNLRQIMQRIEKKSVIALTATATPKVQSDIQKNLGMENARVFVSSFNRHNLFYEIRSKKDPEKELVRFVNRFQGQSGIVYCLSRKKVEEMAETLQVNGVKALPYHAGLDSSTRARHQDAFLMEEVDVVVATIAFGMGIDKPDVRFIVHYDIPKSLESYYQETGRAGRDGAGGHCLAFYSHKDIEKLEKFLHNKPVAEQEIGKQLIQETLGYVESSCCRRVYLLHYFGESFDAEDCHGMCDNCKNPVSSTDAQKDLEWVIRAIQQTNQRMKTQHITAILTGQTNSIIKSNKADQLPLFGHGKDRSELHWTGVIRQAILQGYLKKDIESYGVLKLCPTAVDFLEHPKPFMIREDRDYGREDESAGKNAGSAGALDEVLFKLLKEIRKKMAHKLEIPPFAIFQENSLLEMALHYPVNEGELKQISGVGEGKVKKFGKEFLEVISAHVEAQGIAKDDSFFVRSVANRSANKVAIIQAMDRKVPLDELARTRSMERTELITEIEQIVRSGTRMNIDHHLNEILDEDQIEEVFNYFMEAESESLEEAHSALDGEYDEEEIRLVLIKFLSEVAN